MLVSFILKYRSNPLMLASMTNPKFAGHRKARMIRCALDAARDAVYSISTNAVATGEAHQMMFALFTRGPHICIIRKTGSVVLEQHEDHVVVYPHGLEYQVKFTDGMYDGRFV